MTSQNKSSLSNILQNTQPYPMTVHLISRLLILDLAQPDKTLSRLRREHRLVTVVRQLIGAPLKLKIPHDECYQYPQLQIREPLPEAAPRAQGKRQLRPRGSIELISVVYEPPLRLELAHIQGVPIMTRLARLLGLLAAGVTAGLVNVELGRVHASTAGGKRDDGALGDLVAQNHRVNHGFPVDTLDRRRAAEYLLLDGVEIRDAG